MPKRVTTEDFKQKVYDLTQGNFSVLGDYINSNTKIKMKHNICNYEYEITPAAFLRRQGCRNCANKNKTKTTEQFKKEIFEQVNDEYILLSEYKTSKEKVLMKHNIDSCGYEYEVDPDHFINAKRRCPKCARKCLTIDDFKNEVQNSVNDEYTIYDNTFINYSTKMLIKHNICNNEYYTTPSNFIRGRRCPFCFGNLLKTTEQFKAEVFDLVNTEYLILGDYINDSTKILMKHNIDSCQHEYEVTPSHFLNDKTRCPKCAKGRISEIEKELLDYIKLILPNKQIIENNKTVLDGKEIDILIPELNIGIEFNGLYWHSTARDNIYRKYHLEKTINCKNKNIRLIHIFEDDWKNSRKIIENKLLHIFNKDSSFRIFARHCIIRKINDSSIKTKFLNENHIQGADKANFSYGLHYKDELVALMSFVKPRINMGRKTTTISTGEYELSRYATKYNVVGGFSKLLKYIVKEENIKRIYTYADLCWTNPDNNVYLKNNFNYVSTSQPNYWYVVNGKREGRFNYRKSILKEKFPEIYSDDKTEEEIMEEAGYYRIYDCGHLKYQIDFN